MHEVLAVQVWGRKLLDWMRAEVPAEDDTDLWAWGKIFVLQVRGKDRQTARKGTDF
eukprot:SAG22_NODE_2844_length_2161_cov_4.195441_3_plen_56_part_00